MNSQELLKKAERAATSATLLLALIKNISAKSKVAEREGYTCTHPVRSPPSGRAKARSKNAILHFLSNPLLGFEYFSFRLKNLPHEGALF
jgi:hypothetical protein